MYVDELIYERKFVQPGMESHEEKEVFIKGLGADKDEAVLWQTLCTFECKDVAEILLIKDAAGNSRGKAYVLFQSHATAERAVNSMNQKTEAIKAISSDANVGLTCTWSESERILLGYEGSYKEDFMGKLMGKKASRMV